MYPAKPQLKEGKFGSKILRILMQNEQQRVVATPAK